MVADGMGGDVGISARPPLDRTLPILGDTLVLETSSAGVLREELFGGEGRILIETEGTSFSGVAEDCTKLSCLEPDGLDIVASDWTPTVLGA